MQIPLRPTFECLRPVSEHEGHHRNPGRMGGFGDEDHRDARWCAPGEITGCRAWLIAIPIVLAAAVMVVTVALLFIGAALLVAPIVRCIMRLEGRHRGDVVDAATVPLEMTTPTGNGTEIS